MARTSKSLATGTVCSTIGAGRIPGILICSPAFKMLAVRSPLAWRMASPSSDDVRYRRAIQVLASDGGNAFATLRRINLSVGGSGERRARGIRSLGRGPGGADRLQLRDRLRGRSGYGRGLWLRCFRRRRMKVEPHGSGGEKNTRYPSDGKNRRATQAILRERLTAMLIAEYRSR